MSGTVPDVGHTVMNKADKVLAYMELDRVKKACKNTNTR